MAPHDEIKFMRVAIDKARQSAPEDGRPHPKVGAVAVKDGVELGSNSRCGTGPGDHAEEGLIEKTLELTPLSGCTVYTTLEPCTKRDRDPCAVLLVRRKVGRVVIGMLDPDQRITGKGILHLRRHGVAVDLFPSDLMAELEDLNRNWIKVKEADWAPTVAPAPFRSRGDLPRMMDWAEAVAAKDILMIGQSLNIVLRQLHFFERKLREDCYLRLLIADPRDDGLITTMSRGVVEHQFTKTDLISVMDTVRALRNGLGEREKTRLELKVMNFVPTLSFLVLDGDTASGTIVVELQPNRMEVIARPHVILHAGEPAHRQWYHRFLKNCSDMYAGATPWQWGR